MDMTTQIRCLDATNTSIKSVKYYLYISLTNFKLTLPTRHATIQNFNVIH